MVSSGAAHRRHDISDKVWALLEPDLPGRGHGGDGSAQFRRQRVRRIRQSLERRTFDLDKRRKRGPQDGSESLRQRRCVHVVPAHAKHSGSWRQLQPTPWMRQEILHLQRQVQQRQKLQGRTECPWQRSGSGISRWKIN